jgi:phospholipid-binding lipoprotein MlaA
MQAYKHQIGARTCIDVIQIDAEKRMPHFSKIATTSIVSIDDADGGRRKTVCGSLRNQESRMNRLVSIAVVVSLLALATIGRALADPPAKVDEPGTGAPPAGTENDVSASVASTEDKPSDPDPAESANRAVFAGNQFVDRHLLAPVARTYADDVPARVRLSLHNFVANLGEPSVLVNDALQGNSGRAWTTMRRFVVNTTVGCIGLFDPATGWGLPYHTADFGQTFGVWGSGPGPDVQLPLLGFSNVRDTVGLAVGAVANPVGQIAAVAGIRTAATGVGVVDNRAEALPGTDFLEKSSVDYYATLRGVTAQRRSQLVAQGQSDEP